MNIDKALAKLLKEKESLVDSIELCCKSIEFWEKKAEKVFGWIPKHSLEEGITKTLKWYRENETIKLNILKLLYFVICLENYKYDKLKVY